MILRDVKSWIESLPEEFLEFEVMNAELGVINDTEYSYRLDKPIIALNVDEQSKEILFLNEEEKEKEN